MTVDYRLHIWPRPIDFAVDKALKKQTSAILR